MRSNCKERDFTLVSRHGVAMHSSAEADLVPLKQLLNVVLPPDGDVAAQARALQPAALANLRCLPPLCVYGIDVWPAHAGVGIVASICSTLARNFIILPSVSAEMAQSS